MPERNHGRKLHISGIVQGVGFRPYIYSLAKKHSLTGWVRNTTSGVDIEVEGNPTSLQSFTKDIKDYLPPLASIDTFQVQEKKIEGFNDFQILDSFHFPNEFIPIPADVGICEECLKELLDHLDRRYLYPFINCTNCGPRYTIIQDIPYDRPMTTMAGFPMCPACTLEYNDPANRRFHAQPIACPDCGPWIWLESPGITDEDNTGKPSSTLVLKQVHDKLTSGQILAIKGLGGFHLACDALNSQAVKLLRERKLRVDKPFAVMMPDITTIERHCYMNESERMALISHEKPIVILNRRKSSSIAAEVAPNQNTIGVMLPYTPLHHLLFHALRSKEETPEALVMTSGNLSDEPIVAENNECHVRLSNLADVFLLHNRPIQTRCDDSVLKLIEPQSKPDFLNFIRRARGYAPRPIELAWDSLPVLAVGAELKNTFCLSRNQYAFPSQHIGDMQNYETLAWFEQNLAHLESLFRVHPKLLACDLHPDYLATRYAQDRSKKNQIPLIMVQHHHAHIASVMAENKHPDSVPVIGLAFDGTGYGNDGNIWGGEFFLATYRDCQRLFHLEYMPLPGGDASIRTPARTALAYLHHSGIDWYPELDCVDHYCSQDRTLLRAQLTQKLNTPLTSSMGRLFDAVASIIGIRQTVNYEAQAAIELEAMIDRREENFYPSTIYGDQILLSPLLTTVTDEFLTGIPAPIIAARFHNTIVQMAFQIMNSIHQKTLINTVALSGGVWQNSYLLTRTIDILENYGYTVLTHKKVPNNDGGISLGQAAIAHFSAQ